MGCGGDDEEWVSGFISGRRSRSGETLGEWMHDVLLNVVRSGVFLWSGTIDSCDRTTGIAIQWISHLPFPIPFPATKLSVGCSERRRIQEQSIQKKLGASGVVRPPKRRTNLHKEA